MTKQKKPQPPKPSHPGLHWTNAEAIPEDGSLTFMVSAGAMQVGGGVAEIRRGMPITAEGLEQIAIGQLAAFLGTTGHEVKVLPRPDGEWPDGEITIDGSEPIGIEVAELMDPTHAKGTAYSATRDHLLERIASLVEKKVAKHYDRKSYRTMWLLLWESFPYALPIIDDPGIDAGLLTGVSFDAVWFCHVSGDDDHGIVAKLLP